jgi:cytosine/adenosine deaminase-related metal-dependent hydrolase
MPAMDVLEIATRGGAAVLGRNEIGSIEPSMAADMSFVNMNRLEFAGALHDPASTALFCVPGNRMDRVMVNGNFVVENGRLTTFDEDEIVRKANEISFKMVQRASSRTGKNFLKK